MLLKRAQLWRLSLFISLLFFSTSYADENSQTNKIQDRLSIAFEDGETVWYKNKGHIFRYSLATGVTSKPYDDTVFVELFNIDEELVGLKLSTNSEAPYYQLINIKSGAIVGPELAHFTTDGKIIGGPKAVTTYGRTIYVVNKYSVSVLDLSMDDPKWKTQKVNFRHPFRGATTVAATQSGQIYYGIDNGEWGGGLTLIDFQNGHVSIQERAPGECGDLFYPKCDIVPAIILDPSNPDCIIAPTGTDHLFSRGAIVTVCDGEITDIYRKTKTKTFPSRQYTYEMMFNDIVTIDGGWMATTSNEFILYSNGQYSEHPLPNFSGVKGLSHYRLNNGMLTIPQRINWDMPLTQSGALIVRKTGAGSVK